MECGIAFLVRNTPISQEPLARISQNLAQKILQEISK